MSGRYASSTVVSADRSKAQIEQVLLAYGADQFMYGYSGAGAVGPNGSAVVQFRAHGRLIRFVMPMPNPADPEYTRTATGKTRTASAAHQAWEQATRSRWRALLLAIRAKLEAVDVGLSTFEQEFMAHTVLPDGQTVGEWLEPQLVQAYETGAMPAVMPMLALAAGSAPESEAPA